MTYADRAVAEMDRGYNCAEAMLRAFAPSLGMPDEATRVATPFGGGLSRTGHVCGLVSGAAMAIGWAFGRTDPDDQRAKDAAYAAVGRLASEIEASRGSTTCFGILGVDLRDASSRIRAESERLYESHCRPVAREIAGIVERLLQAAGAIQ